MNRAFILTLALCAVRATSIDANTFVVGGQLASEVEVEIVRDVSLPPGLTFFRTHVTRVPTFTSPTTSQQVVSQQTVFSTPPSSEEERVDACGNRYAMYRWDSPPDRVEARTKLRLRCRVDFPALPGDAPFPPAPAPEEVRDYLKPAPLAQSEDAGVKALAQRLIGGARLQHEAVSAVLNYVADHVTYTLEPEAYDALYALRTGQGNCQNFSNLSAALLRAAGIPARVALGWSIKKGWSVQQSNGTVRTLSLADGRHAWLEVYDPKWGWVPYDAQQTHRFVSTRYVRVSVGFDSGDDPDGLYRWAGAPSGRSPSFRESIRVSYVSDQDVTKSLEERPAPTNHLFTVSIGEARPPAPPPLAALPSPAPSGAERPTPTPPPGAESPTPQALPPGAGRPAPPVPPPGVGATLKPETDLSKLSFTRPLTVGNLLFPALDVFGLATAEGANRYVVESAEYVTGKEAFAQAFDLERPTLVQDVSLALRRFGGQSGQLWLELVDDVNGAPGGEPALSGKVSVASLPMEGGYRWVVFPFSSMTSKVVLTPGRYWVVLRYSGDAICNWFYIYGNPYGSPDGTRSRRTGEPAWNTIRNYDFNFRVRGATAS